MFATFMIDQLDALMLARIQFAFVISWHIIFPAFTIGLASWLTVLEFRWLKQATPFMPKYINTGSKSLPWLSEWASYLAS